MDERRLFALAPDWGERGRLGRERLEAPRLDQLRRLVLRVAGDPRALPGRLPQPHDRDWSYHGVNTDEVVQHPISVTRLVLALRDWQVFVTDLVPARSRRVRLRDLTVGSGTR